MKKVIVVMGSDSDLQVMEGSIRVLRSFGVPFDVRIVSAHRTPAAAEELSKTAEEQGAGVIIAAAGKAAHLAGVLAANTVLPVIGVPVKSSTMDGLDSLLSTVQMPSGIPVATVAINGAENAALLAVQILSGSEPSLREAMRQYKKDMERKIIEKDENIRNQYSVTEVTL
ncbi:MAG: 5-(carboxyamino)imidazole ribonucleotide mutase [Ruminococcaceae bacterium]|jgi:5-(carboxyamino)imidazole ribonucleotide mutase|nr:5-(carboxyamino)imidazole ribonucleotide mutase [Oscillospiraceae bacterium]